MLKDYISYLKGCYYPKLYCKKLSNQIPRANKLALQEEELYAECAVRLSLGTKTKKNMVIVLFFSLSPMANCLCECAGKSKILA